MQFYETIGTGEAKKQNLRLGKEVVFDSFKPYDAEDFRRRLLTESPCKSPVKVPEESA